MRCPRCSVQPLATSWRLQRALAHDQLGLVLQAAGLDDAALGQQIADGRIDVLVGLSSHTRSNGLAMPAWRPACAIRTPAPPGRLAAIARPLCTPGPSGRSLQGVSILSNLGLVNWIVRDESAWRHRWRAWRTRSSQVEAPA
jgi:predicted O-linked N-acetylglucosamine transferase (SPINDLY family)